MEVKKNVENKNIKKAPVKKNEEQVVRKPMNKFQKGVEEMKGYLTSQGYNVTLKEGSKKIFAVKDTSDGKRSDLVVIPMNVDRWILICKVLSPRKNKETGKEEFVCTATNQFDFSTKASKDVIRMYA